MSSSSGEQFSHLVAIEQQQALEQLQIAVTGHADVRKDITASSFDVIEALVSAASSPSTTKAAWLSLDIVALFCLDSAIAERVCAETGLLGLLDNRVLDNHHRIRLAALSLYRQLHGCAPERLQSVIASRIPELILLGAQARGFGVDTRLANLAADCLGLLNEEYTTPKLLSELVNVLGELLATRDFEWRDYSIVCITQFLRQNSDRAYFPFEIGLKLPDPAMAQLAVLRRSQNYDLRSAAIDLIIWQSSSVPPELMFDLLPIITSPLDLMPQKFCKIYWPLKALISIDRGNVKLFQESKVVADIGSQLKQCILTKDWNNVTYGLKVLTALCISDEIRDFVYTNAGHNIVKRMMNRFDTDDDITPAMVELSTFIKVLSRNMALAKSKLEVQSLIPMFVSILKLPIEDNVELHTEATGALCNILVDSSRRFNILESDVVHLLVKHAKTNHVMMQTNAVGALQNVTFQADWKQTKIILDEFGAADILAMCAKTGPLENRAIGLLRNLTAKHAAAVEYIMTATGADALFGLARAKLESSVNAIAVDAAYILAHIALAGTRFKNLTLQFPGLVTTVGSRLRQANAELCVALLQLLSNLTEVDQDDVEGSQLRCSVLTEQGFPTLLSELNHEQEWALRERVQALYRRIANE